MPRHRLAGEQVLVDVVACASAPDAEQDDIAERAAEDDPVGKSHTAAADIGMGVPGRVTLRYVNRRRVFQSARQQV